MIPIEVPEAGMRVVNKKQASARTTTRHSKQPSEMSHCTSEKRYAFEGDVFFGLAFFSPTCSGSAFVSVCPDDDKGVFK